MYDRYDSGIIQKWSHDGIRWKKLGFHSKDANFKFWLESRIVRSSCGLRMFVDSHRILFEWSAGYISEKHPIDLVFARIRQKLDSYHLTEQQRTRNCWHWLFQLVAVIKGHPSHGSMFLFSKKDAYCRQSSHRLGGDTVVGSGCDTQLW